MSSSSSHALTSRPPTAKRERARPPRSDSKGRPRADSHGRPRTHSQGRPRTDSRGRRLTAGGDAVNLDEELLNVLQKEYDEGDKGTKEAIQDAKEVFKEVAQEPMAQALDKVLPRFLSPETEETPSLKRRAGPPSKRTATPRHAMLTARPPARGRTFLSTEGTSSVPNLPESTTEGTDLMRDTTSAPTIPSTSRQLSTASSFVTEKTSWTNLKVTGMDETEGLPRTTEGRTTAASSMTDVSVAEEDYTELHPRSSATSTIPATETKDIDEEELPYTENLLEMPSDSEDAEDIWKSDIVELTKMKSAPKGKMVGGTDVLELKYKEPEWPHQLFLNQILVKLPRLTHLVLDGSELRFLRDLGSSLMSLITLSICECGLRSLDGIYAMPNLRTLIARKNKICIPTQCSFLNRLSYLDLSSNPITSFDEFGNLRQCGELRILKLHDTPIASDPRFNKRMKRLIPQLKEIHPPRFDMNQLKLLRNQDQEKEEEKMKDAGVKKKDKDKTMPSLSYDKVMMNESKTGIAYQKIPAAKKQQQKREPEDVSMGIFMGPKFLQHLEQHMPPSTAEMEKEIHEQVQKAKEEAEEEVDENENKIEEIFRKIK